MEQKFKKGDRVRLINVGDLPHESQNWIVAANRYWHNRGEDALSVGSVLTVTGVSKEDDVVWLDFKETIYSHSAERFELIND